MTPSRQMQINSTSVKLQPCRDSGCHRSSRANRLNYHPGCRRFSKTPFRRIRSRRSQVCLLEHTSNSGQSYPSIIPPRNAEARRKQAMQSGETWMRTVQALTGQPLAEVTERWGKMGEKELLENIARYRECILQVEGLLPPKGDNQAVLRLSEPGDKGEAGPPHSQPVETAAVVSEEPGKCGSALAVYGRPGIDYHVGDVDDLDPSEWKVPPQCVPIHADVRMFNWSSLSSVTQFDVIMMDPPWQLATANPTRGVSLGYTQLSDRDIESLPVPQLQTDGFLFVWVINAKYQFVLDLFRKWGYRLVDEVVWVKTTVNRRLAKSHGFYLQHAKEVCFVGLRGQRPEVAAQAVGSDVILSERRGQSQKPEEIYALIEELVPDGRYLEIFGRKNNLRNFWVTIGNEVTGTLSSGDLHSIVN